MSLRVVRQITLLNNTRLEADREANKLLAIHMVPLGGPFLDPRYGHWFQTFGLLEGEEMPSIMHEQHLTDSFLRSRDHEPA